MLNDVQHEENDAATLLMLTNKKKTCSHAESNSG
jgi:hypothetical protein